MPKTDVHIEASVKNTGNPHQAVHAFVDFEKKKPERHDVTRMVDYTRMIESKYGVEAAPRSSSSTFTTTSSASSRISSEP